MNTPRAEAVTGEGKKAPRVIIGKHRMNGFDGLSDGDIFGHVDGGLWKVSNHTQYGITLKPVSNPIGKPLNGFANLPDYFSFVQAVNNEADSRS